MTAVRGTRRNFLIALGGSVGVSAVGLVRTALLTRELSLEQFGALTIVMTGFAFAVLFLDPRLGDLAVATLPSYLENEDHAPIRGLAVIFCLGAGAVSAIIASAALLGAGPAGDALGSVDPSAIRWFAVGGASLPVETTAASILRVFDRFGAYVGSQLVWAVIGLVALVTTAQSTDMTVTVACGVAAAAMLGHVLTIVVLVLSTVRPYGPSNWLESGFAELRARRSELRKLAVQLNFAGYLTAADDQGAVFLVGALGSPRQAAQLTIARQLVTPIRLVQASAHQSLSPRIVGLHSRAEWRRLISLTHGTVRWLALVSGAAAVVGFTVAPTAVNALAGSGFGGATTPLRILLVAAVLTMISVPYYSLALASRRFARRNRIAALRLPIIVVALVIAATATAAATAAAVAAAVVLVAHDRQLNAALRRAADDEVRGTSAL